MQQIAKVLDKTNKDDIKLLKNHWQEVIDHAKVMIKVFSKFATEFRTSS